jgi:thiol:disulfide interchange protein DsbD
MFNLFEHKMKNFFASPGLRSLQSLRWLRLLYSALLLLATLFAATVTTTARADDFLDPEVAFKFSAKMIDAKTAEVTYTIADGYYMYREHFKFRAEGAKLGAPVYPAGQIHFDETFQKNVETYHHAVSVKLPVQANGTFTLISVGQGCAEKGLCYPPQESKIQLTPPAASAPAGGSSNPKPGSGDGIAKPVAAAAPSITTTTNAAATNATVTNATVTPPAASAVSVAPSGAAIVTVPPVNTAEVRTLPPANAAPAPVAATQTDADTGVFASAIRGGNLLVILPLFFLAGLGLSLTPCVLPMVPILSSIIVGEGAGVTRSRGFALSVIYSFGMAIFYTVIGVVAGMLGQGLAASFQNPIVLSGFALLMAVLSLSMFDVYQLQMPAAIQQKMMDASGKQSAGKFAGVFVMGALSGLIVGPCVAAPLIGALIVISETHNAFLGGCALFTMAAGMSVPLLLVGFSAGWLLPRAGVWMQTVKYFFGVLLLGVAIWMVSPVIPVRVQMLAWMALGIGYGVFLIARKQSGKPSAVFGTLFVIAGLIQLAGAVTNAPDVFSPLATLSGKAEAKTTFVRVKSVAELDAALANTSGKTAMLDFYADWCVSCKEMEKLTFTDPRIKSKFSDMVLLQVDVTANNDDDKALLKRFNLFGPPGIIFFDKSGHEINGGRVIGYQNADKFGSSMLRIFQSNAS